MNSHPGFLDAIHAAPDDDTPRLIYADWLDENGDPDRAEFIRLQIDSARLPEGDPRGVDLDVRAEEILAARETEWLGEWSERLVHWSFQRGFLDAITIEAEPFLTRGDELFQRFPVRKVRFVDANGDAPSPDIVDNIVASANLQRIRSLEGKESTGSSCTWAYHIPQLSSWTGLRELSLGDDFADGWDSVHEGLLVVLCGAPHLANLEALDLGVTFPDTLGDRAVELLADATFARQLVSLVLDGHGVGDTGAIRLATDSRFGRLRRLRLANCGGVTETGLRALLYSETLPHLRDICLSCTADPRILAVAPLVAQLERLDLWPATEERFTFSPEAWQTFGRSPHLERLRHFSVASGILGPQGAAFLRADGCMPALRGLAAWNEPGAGDAIIGALRERPQPDRLTSLELIHSDVSAEGIHNLSTSTLLSGLSKLRLSWNMLQTNALEELLNSTYLSRRLMRLDLAGWDLGEGGFQLLSRCPRLATLTHLNLANTQLDAEGMAALLSSPYLRRLTTLHLGAERSLEALQLLASSSSLPRLREVVVGSGADVESLEALRCRFGARLIVYPE